jgi:ABC-type multidrug transport system fused ATPase/permease subunit
MKMSEDIVVLSRDTKNILRKFFEMKKRISFLKRRIITNKTQLKRSLFSFFFHSFFDFFFDFFLLFIWSRSFFIIIIISYVFFFIITFVFFRNSYAFFRSFVCSSTRLLTSLSFFSSKELIVFAFKAINEKTNELLCKFDFLHEIMNKSIEWLRSNFVL